MARKPENEWQYYDSRSQAKYEYSEIRACLIEIERINWTKPNQIKSNRSNRIGTFHIAVGVVIVVIIIVPITQPFFSSSPPHSPHLLIDFFSLWSDSHYNFYRLLLYIRKHNKCCYLLSACLFSKSVCIHFIILFRSTVNIIKTHAYTHTNTIKSGEK